MYILGRLFQIIGVVARQVWAALTLRFLFLVTFGRFRRKAPRLARTLRIIFEQLGGAFIKLGQIMAMRPDMLPPEFVAELSSLLDAAPPFPGEQAKAVVEAELGKPIDAVFSAFSIKHLAAASFAQVHKATLLTGESVVVKVQRPGVAQRAEADIRLFLLFAHFIDFLGVLKRFRVTRLAQEFSDWTREELDLRVEATYAQRLHDTAQDDRTSYIPLIYWQYTERRVMTMEYLQGIWLSQLLTRIDRVGIEATSVELAASGLDLKIIAVNLIGNSLRQAFEYRLFHADPHAGNLVAMQNNVIGYVDFGITGELDRDFRATQLLIYDAMYRRDYNQYLTGLYRIMKPPSEDIDLDAFEAEIKRNLREWENKRFNPRATLQERSSSWLIMRNLKITRRYGLEVSQMAVRYFRAISVIELIILRLDPAFNIVDELSIYLKQLLTRELAKEVRMEARMEKLIVRRRFLSEALDEMGGRARLGHQDSRVRRRRVSGWRSFMSSCFGLLANGAILCAIAAPLMFYGSYSMRLRMQGMRLDHLVEVALVVWVLAAWIARRLYIASANGVST